MNFIKKFFYKTDDDTSDQDSNEIQLDLTEEDNESTIDYSTTWGQPTLWEFISPSGVYIDKESLDYGIIRENMASRTYFVPWYIPRTGYPRYATTKFFDPALKAGNTDITIEIRGQSRKKAIKDLTNQQTIIRSNNEFQQKQGNQAQLRENMAKFGDIDTLLGAIQFDENRMLEISVTGCTRAPSMKELNRELSSLEDEFAENSTTIGTMMRRVKSGFVQSLPLGTENNMDDTFRNMDRHALAKLDVARSGEGIFNKGIPFAINRVTGNIVFVNTFGTDEYSPPNYSWGIVGSSGQGKSLSAKIKIGREVALGDIYHRIIDPDGEFGLMTRYLNGLNIVFTENTKIRINPCSFSVVEIPIEEAETNYDMFDEIDDEIETELDEIKAYANDEMKFTVNEKGQKVVHYVPVNQTIESIITFVEKLIIGTGTEPGLSVGERGVLMEAIQKVVSDFGITSHPDSLFEKQEELRDGKLWLDDAPKLEPTLSDIYEALIEITTNVQDEDEQVKLRMKADRLFDGIKPFLRGNSKPLFDGQTYFGEGFDKDLNDLRLVNFDISQLDEGHLRPIVYYVLTDYLWEKWLKNPTQAMKKKVLNCDELIQFIDTDSMCAFFEKIARRIRKRNGSFCWMSQDVERLYRIEKAKGILTNTDTYLFLGMNTDIEAELIQKSFNLTDGEINKLRNKPEKGEGILKTSQQSLWIRTNPSEIEMQFVESNKAKLKKAS